MSGNDGGDAAGALGNGNVFEDLFEHADGKIGQHVFSYFLGGGKFELYMWRIDDIPPIVSPDVTEGKDLARIQTMFSSVCRKWKLYIDSNLARMAGLVGAHLERSADHQFGHIVPLIKWLIRHKFKLGWIRIEDAQCGDIALLIDLVEACSVHQLTHLYANIDAPYHYYPTTETFHSSSVWIPAAFHAAGNDHANWEAIQARAYSAEYQALEQIAVSKMAWELGAPYVLSLTDRDFYEALGQKGCPVATYLNVTVTALPNRNANRFISQALFSMPPVSELVLWLQQPDTIDGFDDQDDDEDEDGSNGYFPLKFDGMTLAKITRGLPNLHRLKVSSSFEENQSFRFHIELPSLHFLDVSRLDSGIWISCSCPQLKEFKFGRRSGSLPHVWQASLFEKGSSQVSCATSFFGMDVPDSCKMVFVNARPPALSVEDYMRARADLEAARFDTFEEEEE